MPISEVLQRADHADQPDRSQVARLRPEDGFW